MQLLDPKIEGYLSGLLPEQDPIVQEMEDYAKENDFPIVGPLVGRLCYQMARAINAKRIFELGSGFGYSTYWLAKALPEDGKVFYTDYAEDNMRLASNIFQRSGLLAKIEIRQGNALEILQQIEGQFDLVFNDVDKEYYPASLDLILPRLRKGGILLTDNLFWHGKVVEPNPDRQTQSILKYTKKLYESRDLLTSILPLRDGVGLSYKLN